MRRGSRLARRTGLARRTELPRTPVPRRRAEPSVPPAVRQALGVRSGGWCELSLPGCAGRASDPHHRISIKMGGRFGASRCRADRLSNLLNCCRACHDWVTDNPTASYAAGWSVREHQDPAAVPVAFGTARVLLRDDGSHAARIP